MQYWSNPCSPRTTHTVRSFGQLAHSGHVMNGQNWPANPPAQYLWSLKGFLNAVQDEEVSSACRPSRPSETLQSWPSHFLWHTSILQNTSIIVRNAATQHASVNICTHAYTSLRLALANAGFLNLLTQDNSVAPVTVWWPSLSYQNLY